MEFANIMNNGTTILITSEAQTISERSIDRVFLMREVRQDAAGSRCIESLRRKNCVIKPDGIGESFEIPTSPKRGEWEEDPNSHFPPHSTRRGWEMPGTPFGACADRLAFDRFQFGLGVSTRRMLASLVLARSRDGGSPEITGPGLSVSTKTAGISPSS